MWLWGVGGEVEVIMRLCTRVTAPYGGSHHGCIGGLWGAGPSGTEPS